jgi:serine/threonine-protein kinase
MHRILALPTIVIIASCASAHDADIVSTSSVGVCGSAAEGSSLTLACPTGAVITGITFASYGSPTGACGSYQAGSCNASTSTSVVSNACVGKASCIVAANNATFGDPCIGTDKTLDVEAVCGTPAVCGSVAEGASLTLACPSGQTIASVDFASYGTPAGSCGTFSDGSCNASTSLSVVQAACVGKSSCSVPANNATFGDPCRGTDKTLSAQVTCSGGSGGSGGTGGGGGTGGSGGSGGGGGYFPPQAVWYQDVSNAPADAESSTVISWLDSQGFGTGKLQIDFSIEVLHADSSVQPQPFTPTGDWFSPDCDSDPVPVPPGGALEGENGYACTGGGDCHLIVTQGTKLYEMWRADIENGAFNGGCLAVWDTTRVYGANGRGDGCTSADAAGYPIAALLFSADEVAAGSIDHAIRFILPNSRIRSGSYVHPATHSPGAVSGPSSAPPYGAHLRLRPDFPLSSLPNEGARTVARALMKYGMFLADGGNIALTAQSDRFTTHKWAGLLGPTDLAAIHPRDFVMIDGGTRLPSTVDCVRTQE